MFPSLCIHIEYNVRKSTLFINLDNRNNALHALSCRLSQLLLTQIFDNLLRTQLILFSNGNQRILYTYSILDFASISVINASRKQSDTISRFRREQRGTLGVVLRLLSLFNPISDCVQHDYFLHSYLLILNMKREANS